MERDKLIEILESGSEAELTLIQNYLLDQILKKMPTEAEAIKRCVETSEKVKNLEAEIMRLKLRISSLESELQLERNAKTYTTDTTWTTSPVYVNGYSTTTDCGTYGSACTSSSATTYTSTLRA